MKKLNTNGFTLMEVLIVVMIIGILSAVATPFYRQHVEKEKSAIGISTLRMFADSVERYMELHNTPPTDLSLLDVDIDPSKLYDDNRLYSDGMFTYSIQTATNGTRYVRGLRQTGDYVLGYVIGGDTTYSSDTILCSSPGTGYCHDRLNMTCSSTPL